MDDPVDLRRFAEECLRLAANAPTVEDRAILLRMGQVWIQLVEHANIVQALIERDDSKRA